MQRKLQNWKIKQLRKKHSLSLWESLAHICINNLFGSCENSAILVVSVISGSGTGERRLREVLEIAGMLTNGVIIAIVNHTEFSHHVSTNGCFYGPIVYVTIFLFPVQLFYIKNFGAESVENNANVFYCKVMFLVNWKLVNQQEKLATSCWFSLVALQKIKNIIMFMSILVVKIYPHNCWCNNLKVLVVHIVCYYYLVENWMSTMIMTSKTNYIAISL